jgi:hypothetical protein
LFAHLPPLLHEFAPVHFPFIISDEAHRTIAIAATSPLSSGISSVQYSASPPPSHHHLKGLSNWGGTGPRALAAFFGIII